MGRSITVFTVVAIVTTALLAGTAGAVIGVYRNDMGSEGQRAQIAKLSGERCRAGGSDRAYRVFVGKQTRECSYRTPVIGRDLEIAAVGRLLQGTPKGVRQKAFLALNLRAGGGSARYQLAVFPLQRKAQLRKIDGDGRIDYLHIERGVEARGINRANELRLRAFNVTRGKDRGDCHVFAWVGNELIAKVTDPASGLLQGRTSGFSLGSAGRAKGALGSFDEVVVRVPDPV